MSERILSESLQGRPVETIRFQTLGRQRGHQPREQQQFIPGYTASSGRAETTLRHLGSHLFVFF